MMSEDRRDPVLERVRESYNVPGETPREAMWTAIESRLGDDAEAAVLDLGAVRERRVASSALAWGSERSLAWVSGSKECR